MNTHSIAPDLARPRIGARLAALGVAVLAIIGLSLGTATPALAHDVLVGTSPVGSAEAGDAPGLQLDFNNEVMNIGTEMIGVDASGASVLDGEPVISGRSVTQHLVAGLADGDYEIAWNVVSSDGHPIQGILTVTMVDGYPTEVAPAAPEAEEHDHDHEGEHDHDHADDSADPEMTTQAGVQGEGDNEPGFAALFGWVALFVILGATAAFLAMSARKRRAASAVSGSGTGSTVEANDADTESDDVDADTDSDSTEKGAN